MKDTTACGKSPDSAELIGLNTYPVKNVLPELILDKTTGKNIIFTVGGDECDGTDRMTAPLGFDPTDILPRVMKCRSAQTERTRKKAEVFTPAWIVRMMNDHCESVWRESICTDDWRKFVSLSILEITCGEAPFLATRYDAAAGTLLPIAERAGMLDRKLKAIRAADEKTWLKWAYKAYETTYGYELQGDNLLIARINLLVTFCDYLEERWHRKAADNELVEIADILARNIWQMDGLKDTMPFGTPKRFDFVIGNPPYQDETVGDSSTATPIYNLFMNSSYGISDRVLLITPARFLFNAGYTPKDWNRKMLTDPHFKVIYYNPDSSEVFSGVDIKGGVAITYRDESKDYGAIEIFTRYDELNRIFHKVTEYEGFESICDIIVTSFAYHFTPLMYDENPSLAGRSSKGHEFDLQSNAFDTFPEIFSESPPNGKDCIRLLGRSRSKRCYRYVDRRYVKHVSNLDKYKVFISKAAGIGSFGEVLPDSVLGYPGDGATVTFIGIGHFETEAEAINCAKYICTKFVRTLLGVLKVTQDLTTPKWRYVPLQDFSSSSNIDWSKPVSDIDRQLCKKYGLTQNEIHFIETHVKKMK